MIKITKELIRELADDIMIEMSEEEVNQLFLEEEKIMSDFIKLTNINVDNIKPMHYPFDVVGDYLRDDNDSQTIKKEDMMKNVVDKDKDYVLIKKVVG